MKKLFIIYIIRILLEIYVYVIIQKSNFQINKKQRNISPIYILQQFIYNIFIYYNKLK